MSYKRKSPIPIIEGGTNTGTFATTDGTIIYDGTKITTLASTGTTGQALVSAGAGVAPAYGTLPIAGGGTNATSFATTDGTVYYDGTRLVTTATGTTGQALVSAGAGVAPAYGTLPVAGGGTNATSFSVTDGTVYFDGTRLVTTATGSSGQVLTSGGAGVAPSYASVPSSTFTWNDVTGGSATLAAANGYIADKSTLTTFTMPTNNAIGDTITIVGKGSGGWKIVYTTGQNIIFGTSTTTTTTGNLASTQQTDVVNLVCTTASASAPIFSVTYSIGNITVA